jgi:hypothetical protein
MSLKYYQEYIIMLPIKISMYGYEHLIKLSTKVNFFMIKYKNYSTVELEFNGLSHD